MRSGRLELPHLAVLEPKSSASTNSATSAWGERWDLNPRQPEPQSGALPTELRPPETTLNMHGAPGRIRTCYPRLRRPMLYPNELRAPIIIYRCGRSRGIWTPDPLVPNQMRYQAALCSENLNFYGGQRQNWTADTRIFSPLLYRLSYLANKIVLIFLFYLIPQAY